MNRRDLIINLFTSLAGAPFLKLHDLAAFDSLLPTITDEILVTFNGRRLGRLISIDGPTRCSHRIDATDLSSDATEYQHPGREDSGTVDLCFSEVSANENVLMPGLTADVHVVFGDGSGIKTRAFVANVKHAKRTGEPTETTVSLRLIGFPAFTVSDHFFS